MSLGLGREWTLEFYFSTATWAIYVWPEEALRERNHREQRNCIVS